MKIKDGQIIIGDNQQKADKKLQPYNSLEELSLPRVKTAKWYRKDIPDVFGQNLNNNIKRMRKKEACCIGFERTGSTVAWQIASILLNKDIIKSHSTDQNRMIGSIIYTYRDPRDVFTSMRRVGKSPRFSLSQKNSTKSMLAIHELMLKLQKEKDVLFLKYEDYYSSPRDRIAVIGKFLEFSGVITPVIIEKIHNETSIQKNLTRMESLRSFDEIDHDSNIHGKHIGPDFGKPSTWKKFRDLGEDFSWMDHVVKIMGYSQ